MEITSKKQLQNPDNNCNVSFWKKLSVGPYYKRYVSLNEITLPPNIGNLASTFVSLNGIADVSVSFFKLEVISRLSFLRR